MDLKELTHIKYKTETIGGVPTKKIEYQKSFLVKVIKLDSLFLKANTYIVGKYYIEVDKSFNININDEVVIDNENLRVADINHVGNKKIIFLEGVDNNA